MIGWWDKRAGILQAMVRESEASKGDEYTDDELRQSVVHAREDIVMITSLLSSINRQLYFVHVSLIIIALCAVYLSARTML